MSEASDKRLLVSRSVTVAVGDHVVTHSASVAIDDEEYENVVDTTRVLLEELAAHLDKSVGKTAEVTHA